VIYSEQEIQLKLAEVIRLFKKAEPKYAQLWAKAIRNGLGMAEPPENIPEYYPGYKLTVDHMERVRIHADNDIFPERLFAYRAPNQTDKEAEYIRKNYKHVTTPFFLDYVSTTTRPFSDPNCGVVFKEESDELKREENTFREYIESQIPDYGSIEEFMKGIVPTMKAIDANGVIAVKPSTIFTVVDEETDLILEDTSQLKTPVPYYYTSRQVVGFQEGDFCMIELFEKSEVNYGNTKMKIGLVYEFYDSENIWKITQVGDYTDFAFEIKVYYNHAEGKLPVWRLKGIPRIYNSQLFWMSPLLYVTDILDLVALNASNLQVSINMCVYPLRVMYGNICEFQGKDNQGSLVSCDGGYLKDGNGMPTGGMCSNCGGTGLASRISPMGVMLLRPELRDETGDTKLNQKPMEYVSPETTTLDFLVKKIAEDYNKAKAILHLNYSNVQVNPGGAEDAAKESATQAASGQKALYAFVKGVSDQIFSLYQNILNSVGWQRYGEGYEEVTVKYPTTFDFTTTMDYVNQLGIATKYNLPPMMLYGMMYNYLQSLYNDDKDTASAFRLIVETDRLLTLNNADIQLKLNMGTIEKWEEILHTSAPVFVNQLAKSFNPTCKAGEDACLDTFFAQDIDIQKQELIKLAKARANEIAAAKPNPTATAINGILNGGI